MYKKVTVCLIQCNKSVHYAFKQTYRIAWIDSSKMLLQLPDCPVESTLNRLISHLLVWRLDHKSHWNFIQ